MNEIENDIWYSVLDSVWDSVSNSVKFPLRRALEENVK